MKSVAVATKIVLRQDKTERSPLYIAVRRVASVLLPTNPSACTGDVERYVAVWPKKARVHL